MQFDIEWYRVLWVLRHPITWLKRWKRIREFPVGTLIEDCRFHPCVVVDTDNDGSLYLISMLTPEVGVGSCSLFHCGVLKLTTDEAVDMCKAFKHGGIAEVQQLRERKP